MLSSTSLLSVKHIMQGVAATLRLEELMMRGSDFDLVRFVPL